MAWNMLVVWRGDWDCGGGVLPPATSFALRLPWSARNKGAMLNC